MLFSFHSMPLSRFPISEKSFSARLFGKFLFIIKGFLKTIFSELFPDFFPDFFPTHRVNYHLFCATIIPWVCLYYYHIILQIAVHACFPCHTVQYGDPWGQTLILISLASSRCYIKIKWVQTYRVVSRKKRWGRQFLTSRNHTSKAETNFSPQP